MLRNFFTTKTSQKMTNKITLATLDPNNLTIEQKNTILREFEEKYDVYFEWYADERDYIFLVADLYFYIWTILALCCGDYSFNDIADMYWEKCKEV